MMYVLLVVVAVLAFLTFVPTAATRLLLGYRARPCRYCGGPLTRPAYCHDCGINFAVDRSGRLFDGGDVDVTFMGRDEEGFQVYAARTENGEHSWTFTMPGDYDPQDDEGLEVFRRTISHLWKIG